MKQITIISLHLNFGGVEKIISDIANALVDNYNVKIICTYKIVDNPFFAIDENVEIEYLTSVVPNKKQFNLFKEKRQYFKMFLEGLKSLRILYLRKTSLIKYLKHDKSDIIITTREVQSKYVSRYVKHNCLKIATEHNHHNNNSRYIHKVYSSTKNMDKIVLVSNDLYDFYKFIFKDSNVECEVIAPSVKIEPLKITNKCQEVISVGRLSVEKGFDDLLEVAKINPEIIFNIVGDGDERSFLEKKVVLESIDNVVFHGALNHEEIAKLYEKCKLYIMCSHTESFGFVLIEAMAKGLPCIAFNSAKGACEIINDNINGILVANRSILQMKSSINSLITDDEKLSEYSIEANKTSLEYSFDKFKIKWNELVENG